MCRPSSVIRFVVFSVWFQWCIIPIGVDAGEASGLPSLTLEEAIKLGLGKNPRITMSRYEIDAQAARISQARSGLYPRIDFNESFIRTTNPANAFSMKLNQEEITSQDFDPARLNNPCTQPL